MGRKCQYLAHNDQKCIFLFLTKFGLFGPRILILMGGSKSFGTHVTEKPHRYLVCIIFWSAMGPDGPKMPVFILEKGTFSLNNNFRSWPEHGGQQVVGFFGPEISVFGPKIRFLP